MTQYWINITSLAHFEEDRKANFPITGYKEGLERLCSKVEVGDKLVYYVTKTHSFGAICTVISPLYIDSTPHWSGTEKWPCRFSLNPVLALPKDRMLDVVPLLPSLSFITQKQKQSGKWGTAFMGSLRKIRQQDFELVEQEMRKLTEKVEEKQGLVEPPVQAKSKQVLTGEEVVEGLLKRIRQLTPKSFEMLIGRLWEARGYEDVHVTGTTADGGIDGHFRIPLVQMKVMFQAKRYAEEHNISADLIRQLKGSILGKYDRGVFVTSSNFTAGAKEEAEEVGSQAILVNGEELVRLLLDAGLGVKLVIEQAIIDEDFFSRLKG